MSTVPAKKSDASTRPTYRVMAPSTRHPLPTILIFPNDVNNVEEQYSVLEQTLRNAPEHRFPVHLTKRTTRVDRFRPYPSQSSGTQQSSGHKPYTEWAVMCEELDDLVNQKHKKVVLLVGKGVFEAVIQKNISLLVNKYGAEAKRQSTGGGVIFAFLFGTTEVKDPGTMANDENAKGFLQQPRWITFNGAHNVGIFRDEVLAVSGPDQRDGSVQMSDSSAKMPGKSSNERVPLCTILAYWPDIDLAKATKKRTTQPPANNGKSGQEIDQSKKEQTLNINSLVGDLEQMIGRYSFKPCLRADVPATSTTEAVASFFSSSAFLHTLMEYPDRRRQEL